MRGSGAHEAVTVSFGDVSGLPPGTNTATITFTNLTNGQGTQTRQVQLVMKNQSVSPTTDYTPSGKFGGPFSPLSKTYTVYNGNSTIHLVVSSTPAVPWLSFSATGMLTVALTAVRMSR